MKADELNPNLALVQRMYQHLSEEARRVAERCRLRVNQLQRRYPTAIEQGGHGRQQKRDAARLEKQLFRR